MTARNRKQDNPPEVDEVDEDEPFLTGWSEPVDLTDALKGKPIPPPQVCSWMDGDELRALFYPNEVHSVFGEPESMKSWLLLHAANQQIKHKRHVIYIDMEANDRSIVSRMRALGATKDGLRTHFHYFRPEQRISVDDQEQIARLVRKWKPTLVVLDGVTEAFSLLGLSINAPEDAAQWFRHVARRFQVKPSKLYDGPAIVELDHVVKSRDERNGWAIGSQHKKAGIKGAAYQVETVKKFGRGLTGVSRILLEKDSAGAVGWVPGGKGRRLVAELHCESDAEDGSVLAALETPVASGEVVEAVPLAETQEFRLLMEAVWEFVEGHPGASIRIIRAGVTGSAAKVGTAVEQLASDGFLRNEGSKSSGKYVAVQKFRALQVIPGKKSRKKAGGTGAKRART